MKPFHLQIQLTPEIAVADIADAEMLVRADVFLAGLANKLNRWWNQGERNLFVYVAIPYDGLRHEIIDGDHFANPAPNLY